MSSARTFRHVVGTSNQFNSRDNPRDRDIRTRLSDSTHNSSVMQRIGQRNVPVAAPTISYHYNDYARRKSDRSNVQSFPPVPAKVYESSIGPTKTPEVIMKQEDENTTGSSNSTPDLTMSMEEDEIDMLSSSMSSDGPYTDISSQSAGNLQSVHIVQDAKYDRYPFNICISYILGACRNGEHCRHDHVLSPRLTSQQKENRFLWRRHRATNEICREYLNGSCRFGDICDRIHPEPKILANPSIGSGTSGNLKALLPSEGVKPTISLTSSYINAPRLGTNTMHGRKSRSVTVPSRYQNITRSSYPIPSQNTHHNYPNVNTMPTFAPAYSIKPVIINVSGKGHNVGYHLKSSSDNVSQLTEPRSSTTNRNGQQKEKCIDYSHGSCTWGENCKYMHEDANLPLQVAERNHFDRLINKLASSAVGDSKPVSISSPLPSSLPKQKQPENCTFCFLGLCYKHHLQPSSTSKEEGTKRSLDLTQFLVKEKIDQQTQISKPTVSPTQSSKKVMETITATVLANTRVTIGPGFQVLDVTTGFESSWIILGNLPSSCTEDDVKKIAERHGEVLKVYLLNEQYKSAQTIAAKVQYAKSEQAAVAIKELHGSSEYFSTITAKLALFNAASKTGTLDDTAVRIDLPAPGVSAYAGYKTEADAKKVISSVDGTKFKDNMISVTFHQGLPKLGLANLKFEGLPSDTKESDIQKFGESEGVMFTRARYSSLEYAVSGLRRLLEGCGDVVKFDVVWQAPKDGYIRAWCHFLTPAAAEHAHTSLNARRFVCVGNEKIWVNHIHTLTYSIESNIFSVLQNEVQSLGQFAWKHLGVQLLVFQKDRHTDVKVSGNDSAGIGEIKKTMERMLSGEKLTKEGRNVWDRFFPTPDGFAFITKISKDKNVFVRIDDLRGSLTLIGSPKCRQEAKKIIFDKLNALQARHVYSLPLSPWLVSELLKGVLTKLYEELGRDNVTLHLYHSKLIIRGTDKTFQHAISLLAQGRRPAVSRFRADMGGSSECPICFNDIVTPEKLDCGHVFCRSCLVRYLNSAIDHSNFPLRCLGEEGNCTECIPLLLAKKLLPNSDFQQLIETAFRSFVHVRPKEFSYCPTPDCPQIYRMVSDKRLQCPSCLVRICPNCHEEEHEGEECMISVDEDENLFREWKSKNDVKSCPGCKADIEKSAGCNHMTCSRCQTHICWVCMETFKNGDGIYTHMRAVHGGIGL